MLAKSRGNPNILSKILFIPNLILLILLVLSAYSTYLSPTSYPFLSNSGLAFPILLGLSFIYAILWLVLRVKRYHILFWIVILIISPQLYKYCPINMPEAVPSHSIKILSYNVMNFSNLLKDKNGDNPILSYLKSQNADIVCLQEYSNGAKESKFLNENDINKALSSYSYKSIMKVGNKNSYNKVACFSKFPIKKCERIDYFSNYNGSVAYNIEIDGKTLLLINNHFESNKITQADRKVYEKLLKLEEQDNLIQETKGLLQKIIDASVIREKQAETVAKYIQQNKEKYIIACGDFNDSPLSRTNKILSSQLKDAYTQSGLGLGISYNRNMFYFRIDNILVSPAIKVYDCFVDRSIKDSDHYPIMCYVAF